jgi:hypothetical protein
MNPGGIERSSAGNDMGEHRLPGQRLQDLGQIRMHTFTLARSQDDDRQRHE